MPLILVLGVLLVLAGVVLLVNLFGAADYVMSRVTTKPLGELAPGFAATRRGFRVYSALVVAVGVVCCGIGLLDRNIAIAAVVIVVGALLFGVGSVIAITGEVESYRALKR